MTELIGRRQKPVWMFWTGFFVCMCIGLNVEKLLWGVGGIAVGIVVGAILAR